MTVVKKNTNKNLVGLTFGQLTIVDKIFIFNSNGKKVYFMVCKCSCGNEKNIRFSALKSGSTQSCGCFRRKISIEKICKAAILNTKYTPQESSARLVYNRNYSDGNLSFEKFYHLSQLNCHYCGNKPNNNYNRSKYYKIKSEGEFIYNGLDRVDNNMAHNDNNVVPCCIICNRAKNNLNVDVFFNWVKLIHEKNNNQLKNISDSVDSRISDIYSGCIQKNAKYLPIIASARAVWKFYKNDGISFDDFLRLSQHNCYYCGSPPNNKINAFLYKNSLSSSYIKKNAWFNYNGLDRIDANKDHLITNVVPCCYNCNFAKSNLSFDEFYKWISNIYISLNGMV